MERKYTISERRLNECRRLISSGSQKEDYKTLRTILRSLGYTIPPLYKQYTQLCEKEGAIFLDFGIDSAFENCIDGLILVDIDLIKPDKKNKFFRHQEALESVSLSADLHISLCHECFYYIKYQRNNKKQNHYYMNPYP